MLSNVTHSNSYFECNNKRGCIDKLYIELGFILNKKGYHRKSVYLLKLTSLSQTVKLNYVPGLKILFYHGSKIPFMILPPVTFRIKVELINPFVIKH